MELKKLDKKLLGYLYHNHREPLTKIAKSVEMSREQAEYRIRKYQETGIIRKFATFFNYETLGYRYLVVLMFKFSKKKYAEEFKKKFGNDDHCISQGFVFNKYDIFLNMIFKNETQFQEYLYNLLGKNKEKISDYFILKPFFVELYPLKFLDSKEVNINVLSSPEEVKLDEKDIKMLKLLSENGRARIIDMATSLGISAELVVHRLKKLYNKKVIIGSRIIFDMDKLGYFFSIISLDIKNLSLENRTKLKNFARNSPYVNSIMLTMNKPNCLIQLFHQEEKELRNHIQKLKELLSDENIDNLDVLLIEGEKEANTLPFLK